MCHCSANVIAKLSKMVGDELQKFAEGNESAVPGVIATPKSAAVIDEHMQDQYFLHQQG